MSGRYPGTSTSMRSPSSRVARPRTSNTRTAAAVGTSYPSRAEARDGRIATHRRGGVSPSTAAPRRITPPAQRAIRPAHRAAASSHPSGSTPRSKRCDASVWRSRRRAVSRTPPRVNEALSSRTSEVSAETSDVCPPITPAIATGRSRSQISRSSLVSVRSTSSRVVSRSPSVAVRTTIPGPASRCMSKACSGWPTSSIV
jgi:hypothetical protein